MSFHSAPEVWHKNLVRNSVKSDVFIKEFVNNVKNYEECGRKFPGAKEWGNTNNFWGKGYQHKKNMCRIPGREHEQKDCPKHPCNEVKKEENKNISAKLSESSSDEWMRIIDYESDEDKCLSDRSNETEVILTNLLGLLDKSYRCKSEDGCSMSSDDSKFVDILGLLNRSRWCKTCECKGSCISSSNGLSSDKKYCIWKLFWER